LECGGRLDSRTDGNPRYLCNQGAAKGYLPAAALDLAMYPFPAKALWLGESAVAAARREPGVQVFGKHRWEPPVTEVRFGRAALPAHSKNSLESIKSLFLGAYIHS